LGTSASETAFAGLFLLHLYSHIKQNNIMEITVGELIEHLKKEHPDLPLDFGGLEFYRLKDRGAHVQFEFSQTVYQDKDGCVVVENHELPPRKK
jgi:hypothetical protein